MKKYGNTNSDGLCTVINPYKRDIFNSCETKRFYDFQKEHPPLPLYDPSGQLIKDAENVEVEGPVWQYILNGKYIDFVNQKPGLLKQIADTRQIYRLLTVQPTENLDGHSEPNICIVCDEDRSKKVFCADCGLNKADEQPAPMSSKGIKSADEMVKDTPPMSDEDTANLMEAYHGQFATEAGGESEAMEEAHEISIQQLRLHFDDKNFPLGEIALISRFEKEYNLAHSMFMSGFNFNR